MKTSKEKNRLRQTGNRSLIEKEEKWEQDCKVKSTDGN